MRGTSLGGYPITGAIPQLAGRLRQVVYWSTFVPGEGACLLDELPPPAGELFPELAQASGDDTVAMPWEVWHSTLIQDAPAVARRLTHGLMVPQPMSYFRETVAPLDAATLACRALLCLR